MMSPPEPVVVEVVAPTAVGSRQILRAYMDEVASRYYGRQASGSSPNQELRLQEDFDGSVLFLLEDLVGLRRLV
jgi:hypothetical protein